jgi:8-oxo-dGTP diphosphatase
MRKIEELYQDKNYCIKCGSKLEIKKDRENKIRAICPNCNHIVYLNPIPASACLIVNEKNEVLIIKRKFEPNPGEWALPSGYIEIYQTPEEAAVSEMKEETGLDGEVIQFLDYYSGYSPIYEKVISFGFLMRILGGTLKAGDDAAEAKFVSFEKLPPLAFDSHNHYINLYKNRSNK